MKIKETRNDPEYVGFGSPPRQVRVFEADSLPDGPAFELVPDKTLTHGWEPVKETKNG